MNVVEPIRDEAIIEKILIDLRATSERNYVMFFFGIYSGLRISDILKLKVEDVRGKIAIRLKEKKTQHNNEIELVKPLQDVLKVFCANRPSKELLFLSRVGVNKAISRGRAYEIINASAQKFGLNHIGTHTMRKTFGYHFYKMYKDIAILQEIFKHSDPSITLKYIGINNDEKRAKMRDFRFNISSCTKHKSKTTC